MHNHFQKLKSNLELDATFEESISTRHNAIRSYLQNNHPRFKDSKLIGSVARKTRIHPGSGKKFDIDILVILGEFFGWVSSGGISPQGALDQLNVTVNRSSRYGEMNPSQDAPTVTVTYEDDIQTQLVPAYVDMIGRDQNGKELGSVGRGYWIVKNGRWEMADYDHEAEYITNKNKLSSGYLIPTVKMLKAVKSRYFPELDSFPLEIIAANVIPASVVERQVKQKPVYYSDLLQDFFDHAPSYFAKPIGVPGSKSNPIVLNQDRARRLTDKFTVLSDHVHSTNNIQKKADKITMWKELFPDHFPTRV